MAEYTQTPQGGFATHQHPEYAVASSGSLGKFTNIAGAAVSLALVIGVGIWGYKLLVRDVSGIPVVRAASGEMRVRPEEPGGQLAQHQGLSVNTIAAIGTSDGRADELHLAPQSTDLADEDQPMPQLEETAAIIAPQPQTPQPQPLQDQAQLEAPAAEDIATALETGSVESLVAQLTDGIAPLEALEEEAVPVLASVASEDVPALLTGEGVQVSLRPTLRPKRRVAETVAAAVAATPVAASGLEVDASSLPAGTRLVQLGAFDSPEIARAQWGKLNARFAPFMEGKKRVVMKAKSGGRTFYRLRAQGFEDIGDARRFCSALVAESVDCIPVVTR
ncbi:SPOR domain-containing protein [Sulfitobacter donghicola]|uniref:SPOR domain-containing protein n=1 Tax=Sulfitobacter donghicola DSW-25 = KCTC 12864 = JCM 14565 TaxID=1300350 RepID=A0A073IIH7_9RHOB|nr:SPOR domain-containing protein [Sulfitobacter donghicola]KEJ89554.1 hypothetical protein DSW25_11190 [Sulfitobacter donghicola DSW-25 = KCTC 12864 = JCM 14565]KIN69385.1 Sporulation related protein [Sulfitobacter donghicola DSW-25 = KCTC 12864 = JCM 14565]